MDIVLPLLERDLERYLRLQRPTFERFYADLGATWIVCRTSELARIAKATSSLPGVRIVDERELIPELSPVRMLLLRRQPSGWHIQQLIKLAAVAEAESQFSLVADADVVAVGPVADADLIVDGRALRPKYPLWKPHAAWSRWASRVLNLPPMDYQAALTPSVLASDAVRSLAAYVEACVPPRSRARIPAAIPGARRLVNSWRSRLISAIPWTEYELYDMFLAGNGSFERFHWTSPTGVPRLYADCVWVPDDFENWVTAPVEDRSYFFSVVQSNCNIPVEVIEERLRVARVLD